MRRTAGRTGGRAVAPAALAALLVTAASAGCVVHRPLPESYAGPEELPPALADLYDYPQRVIAEHSERVLLRLGVTVREIEFPSTVGEDDRHVRFELYEVDSEAPTPVVLVLPIFNGQLLVSRYFARYFANRGIAAVVVDRGRTELREDLRHPEEALRMNLADYRLIVDWLVSQPSVDGARVGVFGLSFGGMDAVMLAAVDERVGTVVAAMAGADIAYTLMNTSYGMVNRALTDVLESSGLSREEMSRLMEETIATEPLALAPYVDAEDVLLVLTRADSIVPFDTQEALRDVMGEPESLYLPVGHRTSVLYFPYLRDTAYDFFARRFELRGRADGRD